MYSRPLLLLLLLTRGASLLSYIPTALPPPCSPTLSVLFFCSPYPLCSFFYLPSPCSRYRLDPGCWILDVTCLDLQCTLPLWFKAQGSRLKAKGSRLKAQGSRLKKLKQSNGGERVSDWISMRLHIHRKIGK
ncbi:hypothetical protein K474DRAFT_247147 [Panus rudis PR-1116 ss-1]|nr:hypothetical protein K474DRAFT_247147 [Panus rudis PR-1116 ss-1]